jgi:hypothetical protein
LRLKEKKMRAEAFWGIDHKESIPMTAEGETIEECIAKFVNVIEQVAPGGKWYPLKTWVNGEEVVLHHADAFRKVFTLDDSVVVAY